jgi:hypothetical protein
MKTMCDSKELLVGYLYDDLDDAERRAFDGHVLVCLDCRNELAALRATRGQMAAWAPPVPDLGLRMVRGAPSAPRSRMMGSWGLAAAAALVLAASAAIANLEIRYGADGLTVRTGWARGELAAAPAGNLQTVSAPADVATTRADFEAINQRLLELETAVQRAPVQVASGPVMTDAELLKRVRQFVSEAESRQQREVALQMAQMFRDFDRQRRTDLALIQQGLGQYQGLTNAELATTRDLVNQLVRVSTRQEK